MFASIRGVTPDLGKPLNFLSIKGAIAQKSLEFRKWTERESKRRRLNSMHKLIYMFTIQLLGTRKIYFSSKLRKMFLFNAKNLITLENLSSMIR